MWSVFVCKEDNREENWSYEQKHSDVCEEKLIEIWLCVSWYNWLVYKISYWITG